MVLRCSIKDTGIGISEENIAKIFRKFNQADTSTTRKYGGTGLGLAICKEIITLMEGEIGVISKKKKGSEFWFTLKLAIDKNQPDRGNELSSLEGAKLLIVDDNELSRHILAEHISNLNTINHTISSRALDELLEKKNETGCFDMGIICPSHSTLSDLGRITKKIIRNYPDIALIYISTLPYKGERKEIENFGFKGYFTKPIHINALRNGMAKLIEAAKAKDDLPFITIHDYKNSQQESEKPAIKPDFSDKRILIVDDNEVNRTVLQKILEKYNFQMQMATDGIDALNAVARQSFDLVLMDCQMPNMDGYEATRYIRHMQGEDKHTPIIAITAHALKGDAEKCFEAGMDDYLSKPVKIAEIEKKLTKWVK